MTEAVPGSQRVSLAGYAGYLATQHSTILEQWQLIVRRDTQLETADRLPHRELIDHLPQLLQDLGEFLRARDADILTADARRDASRHGELRWQGGYQIDELLRELEVFRQLVTASTFRYRDAHPDFKGSLEMSAHALIHQFFAEITVASARQFVNEQSSGAHSCLTDLATAQQELGRTTVRLERALQERHLASTVVARELRQLLQQLPPSEPLAASVQALHSFVEQLQEYAQLSGGGAPIQRRVFDPRALFSEIVAAHRPAIEARGLRLLTDCVTAPATVTGDREKIARVVGIFLDTALQNTHSGQISLVFLFADSPRWTLRVMDTRPDFDPGGAVIPPGGNIDLAIAAELICVMGGSLNTEIRAGAGVSVEVSLPRL